MRPYIYLVTIYFFCTTLLSAQSKHSGALTGKILDGSTNLPLEYATVSVINIETGKTINGSIADAKGEFKVSGLPDGTFRIVIGFIGYENITIDSVSLNSTNRTVSLGNLSVDPSVTTLQNVIVTGDRPIVESRIDKIVYNVSNDITSQGGAAIDVLKKVPQVTVDVDGNVELQGNSNVRFLINGKPSSVFGSSLADALASIPASQIRSIEAITNPGAKYDSQGTGGIINIILHDNNMKGVNGNINLTGGTRWENASVNLNMRKGKFGVNAYFGANAVLKSKVPGTQQRITNDTVANNFTTLYQDGVSDFQRHGLRSGIGFDWDISKNNILTGSLSYNKFGNQNSGITNQEEFIKDLSDSLLYDNFTLRNSENQSRYSSFDWSLDYKKKFKKEGHELEILYNASHGSPYAYYTQTQSYLEQENPYMGQSSVNPGNDNETEISIDYTNPVSDGFMFETGIKSVFQRLHSIADVSIFMPSDGQFVHDPLQSYDSKYSLNIYAGYFSANFKVFNFLDIKSGIRYEFTDVSIDDPNASIPSYGTIVPSMILSHNFDKTHSIKLSYSKRIERPDYRELNPFVDLSDPYNITTGNPYLKPEIGNNIELGYNAGFSKGGNISVSLIAQLNSNDDKRITTYYPEYIVGDSTYTNVSVTTTQNVGEEYNTGLSASGSYPVTKNLNLRANVMLSYRYSVSNLTTGSYPTGIRARFNMNINYKLPKDLAFEFFGMYSAPSQSIQGKVPQFFMYNFALKKMFHEDRGSFGLTMTNPFNKYINQVRTISTENYVSKSILQRPFRSFGVNFTYKFGKLEFTGNKEDNYNNGFENNGQ